MVAGSGTELGRLLTIPGPLWPSLFLLSCHTRLSQKSFQQLRQRTDFIPVVRRERTSRMLGEAAWFWKQIHPKIPRKTPRMQSCCLQLSHKHHFPGTMGTAVPSPCTGRALCFLASSGQHGAHHHHSTGTSMELAACAPLEHWNQRRAQETLTRAKERWPQKCLCLPNT